MAFKIFYAWQNDRPNNQCRGLIKHALEIAAANLNTDLKIEEVVRPIDIDQDTQGVPGSPSVAQTILDKIEACNAFVADLTYIPTGEGAKLTPNPNVLIEYGYALRALSDQRIIGVFNNAFGEPNHLPFDLQHKRWPIRYNAVDDSATDEAKAQRRDARKQLANDLEAALRDIIRTFAEEDRRITTSVPAAPSVRPEQPAVTNSPPFVEEPTVEISYETTPYLTATQRYPWNNGLVGIRDDRKPGEAGYEIGFRDGPAISLQLKSYTAGKQLSNAETIRIAREDLRPLASYRASGWSYVRNRNGAAAFTWLEDDPNTAITASLLARNGELYGLDCYHLQIWRNQGETDDPYIPTGAVEEIFIDGLADFLNLARYRLQLSPPLEVIAGLDGIEGYRLAVDPKQFMEEKILGRILYPSIGDTVNIDNFVTNPFDVLLPLFVKIYDAAGLERPEVRTVGKSQR